MPKFLNIVNSKGRVIIDDEVYEWLLADPLLGYYGAVNTIYLWEKQLMIQFSYYENWKKIYYKKCLRDAIAEIFLARNVQLQPEHVVFSNSNIFDCRLHNINHAATPAIHSGKAHFPVRPINTLADDFQKLLNQAILHQRG